VKRRFVRRPGRAGGERLLVGALDLALHLGLADDHRLQARADAEELACGIAVARRVEALGQLDRAHVGAPGEHPEQPRSRRRRIGDDERQLGAVAGRDDDRLVDVGVGGDLLEEAAHGGLRQRQALAQLDGRRLVRDPERDELVLAQPTGSRSRSGTAAASRASTSLGQLDDLALDPAELLAMIAT